jgi:hypothetical protein
MTPRSAKSPSGNPAPSRPSLDPERAAASFLPGATPAAMIEPAIRFVTDSLLAAPELPKPPASPRLRPGRDFTPMPGGEPQVSTIRPRVALPSTVQPSRSSNLALAVFAVAVGFGGGMLVAWLAGLI